MIGLPKALKFDYDTNLQAIADSGRKLQRIVSQMIDLAELRKGKLNLQMEPVSLNQLFNDMIGRYKAIASRKQLKLTNLLSKDLRIQADPFRFHQIIDQLFDNAVKFTASGEICLAAATNGKMVVITATDIGVGIPAEQLKSIFDLFVQGDSSEERAFGGLGIGLSIAKQLTEAHQGTIHCESVPDKGTTFSIHLPAFEQNTKKTALSNKPASTHDDYVLSVAGLLLFLQGD